MIPKKIHYCWFGNNEKPKLISQCIASWKTYCPDYQIIEWNETNFDVNSIPYCKQAYEEKKFAFVSDVARMKILHEYGGIYLDTDVELVKSLDGFLKNKLFLGFETNEYVNPGLIIGSIKSHQFVKEILEYYLHRNFKHNNELDLTTIVKITTDSLKNYGLIQNGENQLLLNEIQVYSKNTFNPTEIKLGKTVIYNETHSVHHFAGSWLDSKSQRKRKFVVVLQKVLGSSNVEKMVRIKNKVSGKLL